MTRRKHLRHDSKKARSLCGMKIRLTHRSWLRIVDKPKVTCKHCRRILKSERFRKRQLFL